jgi:hypothetical protein
MLGKAHYEERRSLWYNNGRSKSKLNMASRGFHHRHIIKLDDQYGEVESIKGFHYYYKMELDDLNNKFTKFNIKWFSLLLFVKITDLFKEAICETSS